MTISELSLTIISIGEHQSLQDIRQRDDAFHNFLLIHDHQPVNLNMRRINRYVDMQLFLSYYHMHHFTFVTAIFIIIWLNVSVLS